MRRRKSGYFERIPGAPTPWEYSLKRRARFGEVDAMAVVWHGHYATWFEEAATELRRVSGLTYEAFHEHGLRAPVVQFHVDYFQPVRLDEEVTIRASWVYSEALRMNVEYQVLREDGAVAAAGYSVHLITSAETGEVCFTPPPLIVEIIKQWFAREGVGE